MSKGVRRVVPTLLAGSDMFGQANQLVLCACSALVYGFIHVNGQVDNVWVGEVLLEFAPLNVESLDVEDNDLGQVADLHVVLGLGFLLALFALVLVLGVELSYFKLLLQTLFQRALARYRQTRKWLEGKALVLAVPALYDRPIDPCEDFVDAAWVADEVFLENLVVGPPLLRVFLAVKLWPLRRRFFVLQLSHYVH